MRQLVDLAVLLHTRPVSGGIVSDYDFILNSSLFGYRLKLTDEARTHRIIDRKQYG